MKRRNFVLNSGLALGGLTMMPADSVSNFLFQGKNFTSNRPPQEKRTFICETVEKNLLDIKSSIADKEIAWMFENCYPNTLDTTVDYELINGRPDTFIITGDINAMWLRDSTAQVWPYTPLMVKDEKIKNLVLGLVNRQVKCVLTDPYANAFYKDLTKESEWKSDRPSPGPGVHERKFEVDSLCYVVRLSDRYYKLTNDKTVFEGDWDKAMRLIVKTLRTEQRKDGKSPYYFIRTTNAMIDAPLFGNGRPVKSNGLICSMFRPSDDSTLFPYLIPSNIFAVLSLRQLSEIYSKVLNDQKFAAECTAFANEVDDAIKQFGVANHLGFGKIYAYEADGFGNQLFMDDANVPSLISLTYLGAHKTDDPIYVNTRKFVLSDSNPYYLKGKAAEGQASPHTGKERIWPMGIILRAMTSVSPEEITYCLRMLKNTHYGTGFMHEAVNKDNPADFSRKWFAWANTLFGELIIKVHKEHGEILAKQIV